MEKQPQLDRRELIRSAAAALAVGAMGPARLWAAPGSKYTLTSLRVAMAPDNPSVCFDPAKCMQCGACKSICRRTVSVDGFYDLARAGDVPVCVHCGLCTTVCESGALANRPEWPAAKAAKAAGKTLVVSVMPTVRIALAEEFGRAPGTECGGEVAAALRALGADYVLDAGTAADLAVMESAAELARRVRAGKHARPLFTSRCPAWVQFCETYYPEMLPNVSTAKSPVGMQGETVKAYLAQKLGLDPARVFHVALTPCTAHKFEVRRPSYRGTDAVLTTRELADWMRADGVDYAALKPAKYDAPTGEASGAAALSEALGGGTEAILRTAYRMLNGKAPPADLLEFQPMRGLGPKKDNGFRRASVELQPGVFVTVLAVYGLANVRKALPKIKGGAIRPALVEVSACKGGCIGGGGQPRGKAAPYLTDRMRQARLDRLYALDARSGCRTADESPAARAAYRDLYGQPGGEKARAGLHTSYISRSNELG